MRSVVAATVVAAAVLALATVALVSRADQLPPAPDGGSGAPAALPGTSDAFDGWTLDDHDPNARFLATDAAAAGGSALMIERSGPPAATPSGLRQQVAVAPGTTAVLSFRAMSDSGARGAVRVTFGLGAPDGVVLLGGSYGWRSFTVSFPVPAGVDRADVVVVAAGNTTGTVIDAMTVRDGGAADLVNGGFEGQSADLRLTDDSLLLQRGRATLHLLSRRADSGTVAWTVTADAGSVADRGQARIAQHAGTVPLGALPPGYYGLRVTGTLAGRAIDRSISFGVVDGAAPAGLTRFGLGVPTGGETGDVLARKVAAVTALGVGAVRTSVNWGNFERSPGVYTPGGDVQRAVDAFQGAGIDVLLVAHYPSPFYDDGTTPSSPAGIAGYAAFAAAVATAYPGTELDVQNEPNAATNTSWCGRTPACYLRLLQPAAAAVRTASPGTVLSAPALAGGGIDLDWLRGFVAGGGLASTDVVSVHPYYRPARPDALAGQLASLQDLLQSAAPGAVHPIWITEFGDPTVPDGLSGTRQAQDLVQATATGLARGAQRVYWYDELDHTPIAADPESDYGLFTTTSSFAPDAFEPKPAAVAEAVLVRRLRDLTATGYAEAASGLRDVAFGTGAATVHVLWSNSGAATAHVSGGAATVTDALGSTIALPADRAVVIGPEPVYVQGDVQVTTP